MGPKLRHTAGTQTSQTTGERDSRRTFQGVQGVADTGDVGEKDPNKERTHPTASARKIMLKVRHEHVVRRDANGVVKQ